MTDSDFDLEEHYALESEPGFEPFAVVFSEDYMKWQLKNGVTDPIRAGIAFELLDDECGRSMIALDPNDVDVTTARDAIESVHDRDYVAGVIDKGVCGEFPFDSIELGETARLMFAGTMKAVYAALDERIRFAFNPQGAKHHAQFDAGSGFCAFNDMAWAAQFLDNDGHRPLYLDWDVHAGDGVQSLLWSSPVPTLSIHQGSIFPMDPKTKNLELARAGARHTFHHVDNAAYNWNVEKDAGDDAFRWAIDEAIAVIRAYEPKSLLLAIGADGHAGQSLGTGGTRYTYAGFDYAASAVREVIDEVGITAVVIGGAGGYQPQDHTPRIWANVIKRLVRSDF